jgi:hypothetical protein
MFHVGREMVFVVFVGGEMFHVLSENLPCEGGKMYKESGKMVFVSEELFLGGGGGGGITHDGWKMFQSGWVNYHGAGKMFPVG